MTLLRLKAPKSLNFKFPTDANFVRCLKKVFLLLLKIYYSFKTIVNYTKYSLI